MTIFELRPYATREKIVLFHDYLCPWCWVGWIHATRLSREFGVTFDWRGAELYPPELEPQLLSQPGPSAPRDPNRPLTRFDRFCQTEQIFVPEPRPGFLRTHRALLGAEFVKATTDYATELAWHEAVYRAYWERCEDIESLEVLAALGESVGLEAEALRASIRVGRYRENILPFDDGAYAVGIRHVPTFLFGGEELLAEAHYSELAYATQRFLVRKPA